jgi:hypothetical protein
LEASSVTVEDVDVRERAHVDAHHASPETLASMAATDNTEPEVVHQCPPDALLDLMSLRRLEDCSRAANAGLSVLECVDAIG